MKRRVEDVDANVPPAELTDYPAWCRLRGWEPYAASRDPVSQRACVAQYAAWERERQVWEAAHGVGLGGGGRAPFDVDAI
jgi:hypothetical protein